MNIVIPLDPKSYFGETTSNNNLLQNGIDHTALIKEGCTYLTSMEKMVILLKLSNYSREQIRRQTKMTTEQIGNSYYRAVAKLRRILASAA